MLDTGFFLVQHPPKGQAVWFEKSTINTLLPLWGLQYKWSNWGNQALNNILFGFLGMRIQWDWGKWVRLAVFGFSGYSFGGIDENGFVWWFLVKFAHTDKRVKLDFCPLQPKCKLLLKEIFTEINRSVCQCDPVSRNPLGVRFCAMISLLFAGFQQISQLKFVPDRMHDGMFQHCFNAICYSPTGSVNVVKEAFLRNIAQGQSPNFQQMLQENACLRFNVSYFRRRIDFRVRQFKFFAHPGKVSAGRI
jgi:hypothetical protein